MNRDKINKITEYIFINSKPQRADLAIVFGTRHKAPLLKISELYENGFVSKILLTGGINKKTGDNEAEEMSKYLIKIGINKNDLILENKSINSLENVLFSKKKIEKCVGFDNIKKIILITKHYHSRRIAMTMKKHFPKSIKLIPITYEIYGFTKDDWSESSIGKKKVLGEWRRIPKYLAKGDIEEL